MCVNWHTVGILGTAVLEACRTCLLATRYPLLAPCYLPACQPASLRSMYFVTPYIVAGLAGTPLLFRLMDGPYRLPTLSTAHHPPTCPRPVAPLRPTCQQ